MNAAQRHLQARRQKNILESLAHAGLECIESHKGPYCYAFRIGEYNISFCDQKNRVVYTITYFEKPVPRLSNIKDENKGIFQIQHPECCHNYDDFIHHILDLIRRGE